MSAFGYFGSKRRIAAKIKDRLPPHNAWVELFCGSAAMTLAKKPAPIEIINDINGDVVNFFRQLQSHASELKNLIYYTPYSRAELERARDYDDTITDLERARRFFVAAMMSINGVFGEDAGGFSFTNSYARNGMEARVSRWNGMPDHVEWVAKRLKSVRVEQQDAIHLFKKFRYRPASLIYLDPPYLGERSRGYTDDQTEVAFHRTLLRSVVNAKCMLFISGYSNELYDEVLTEKRGWTKETIRATTKGNNGKSFERLEVLWFNQPFVKARSRGRISLRFTKAEARNGKINPERQ